MKIINEDLELVTKYNNLAIRVEDKLEEMVQYVVFESDEADIFSTIWDYYFQTQGSDDLDKEIKLAIRDFYALLGIEHQHQVRMQEVANETKRRVSEDD